MYAKAFGLYKLKRIISEKFGKTRKIGENAFHVKSSKKFMVSLIQNKNSEMTLKIFSYPIEYRIRIFKDSTVKDILIKLEKRNFIEPKQQPMKKKKQNSPMGITGNYSTK